MDKQRISKIITEAESKIAALDEALATDNNQTANWILVVLAGIIQDLRRLAEEEPIPIEIDKQKLSESLRIALSAVGEGRQGIGEGEYHLTQSDSVLLSLALHDIYQIINAEPITRI